MFKLKMNFRTRMLIVCLLVLVMFALHNSFWLWDLDGTFPLLFSVMPFAYFYYVLYAILSILVILMIMGLAWPDPPAHLLERADEEAAEKS